MIEVRNNGVPLIEHAPKAAITQSIIGLADALFHDENDPAPAAPAAKPSPLARLLSLWSSKS